MRSLGDKAALQVQRNIVADVQRSLILPLEDKARGLLAIPDKVRPRVRVGLPPRRSADSGVLYERDQRPQK